MAATKKSGMPSFLFNDLFFYNLILFIFPLQIRDMLESRRKLQPLKEYMLITYIQGRDLKNKMKQVLQRRTEEHRNL